MPPPRQCLPARLSGPRARARSRHGVHPNRIYGCKKLVVDNMASLFARGASASGDREEARAGDCQALQQDWRIDGRAGFLGQEAKSMSAPARRAKVERSGAGLSVRRQCQLLNVARSGVHRPRPGPSAADLALMRRIDELYLERPFYGSRRMTFDLNEEGRGVNRKRVQRPMRHVGLDHGAGSVTANPGGQADEQKRGARRSDCDGAGSVRSRGGETARSDAQGLSRHRFEWVDSPAESCRKRRLTL